MRLSMAIRIQYIPTPPPMQYAKVTKSGLECHLPAALIVGQVGKLAAVKAPTIWALNRTTYRFRRGEQAVQQFHEIGCASLNRRMRLYFRRCAKSLSTFAKVGENQEVPLIAAVVLPYYSNFVTQVGTTAS